MIMEFKQAIHHISFLFSGYNVLLCSYYATNMIKKEICLYWQF